MKDLVSITDLNPDEIQDLIKSAVDLKRGGRKLSLDGRTLALSSAGTPSISLKPRLGWERGNPSPMSPVCFLAMSMASLPGPLLTTAWRF